MILRAVEFKEEIVKEEIVAIVLVFPLQSICRDCAC